MNNWFQKLRFGLKKSSSNLTSGISGIFTKQRLDRSTLDELEELLICADMGISASTEIINKFANKRLDKDITPEDIRHELAENISEILTPCQQSLTISGVSPEVILMVGVNGAGKTTTIGKLAAKFIKQGQKVSAIAGDTFRAAAVEQLEIWGKRNDIRVFKGENGGDAAGLCYDGLQEAIKQKDDIVFIDTAGRLQNKTGLMDELRKIVKVIKKIIPEAPHHTLLCLDATTGQNALNQVKTFKEIVNVNGLIINKLDGTAKGGILVAIAKESPTAVHYIGIGEGIDDLDEFNAKDFALGLLDV